MICGSSSCLYGLKLGRASIRLVGYFIILMWQWELGVTELAGIPSGTFINEKLSSPQSSLHKAPSISCCLAGAAILRWKGLLCVDMADPWGFWTAREKLGKMGDFSKHWMVFPPLVFQTKAAYVLFYQRRDDEFYKTPSLSSSGSSDGGTRPSSSQQGLGDDEACSMDTN